MNSQVTEMQVEHEMASGYSSEEDSICPGCHGILINPVFLPCDHSVCRCCISRFGDNESLRACPVCQRRSSMCFPPVNLASMNNFETFLEERRQTSFSGFETICSVHKGKLKLFCLDDKELVCLVCRDSRKHTNHRFCPLDEAATEIKEIFKSELKYLQDENLRTFENIKKSISETAEQIKFYAQRTEWHITEEFKKLHQLLHDEEATRIKALREEEKQKIQMMKEKVEKMNQQISSLTYTIRDIEEQMNADDLSFLQNFNATMQRAENLPVPEPGPAVMINFPNHLSNLKLSLLQKMQENVGESSDFSIDRSDFQLDMDFPSGRGKSTQIFRGQQFQENPRHFPISFPCETEDSNAAISTKKPAYYSPDFPEKRPPIQITRTTSIRRNYLPATSNKGRTPENEELQSPDIHFPIVKDIVKKMNQMIFDKK